MLARAVASTPQASLRRSFGIMTDRQIPQLGRSSALGLEQVESSDSFVAERYEA